MPVLRIHISASGNHSIINTSQPLPSSPQSQNLHFDAVYRVNFDTALHLQVANTLLVFCAVDYLMLLNARTSVTCGTAEYNQMGVHYCQSFNDFFVPTEKVIKTENRKGIFISGSLIKPLETN